MRGTNKARPRPPLDGDSQEFLAGAFDELQRSSALKQRRNKKNVTAAQAVGKTTGRWTEEEHQRFNEGKPSEFKSFPDLVLDAK